MAFPDNNPLYGSGRGIPASRNPQRLALDNLLRRELKIGDPNDPNAVASALLDRFKNDRRAAAIAQEANGLPFLQSASFSTAPVQAATSSGAELKQATDDVERDLQELLSNSLLKDVTQELQGWAQAVRSAIAEGTTAARFALDPRQRDKAFAIRRQLGDYARLARLVGALTPVLSATYRNFAQSLDEVAAVILVLMGEALSNVGFNGGRFLLQAPYTELQTRRDAAIYALRNLVGATQEAYGPNDWPRGLDAYRNLFQLLEAQGHGDLRSLLTENELARIMDELIQRSAHGTSDGLRALGSTAQIDLERFRRLVFVGQNAVSPESPPFTAFLEAIQLFADAFDASGGFRLLRISRPPILFYGLYGMTVLQDADQRLLNLIIERGLLAEQLDCFLQCACTSETVKCQVILDKILYDLDRAIDLYAMGKENFGQPERRAAAYSFVIEAFVNQQKQAVIDHDSNCGLYYLDDNGQTFSDLRPKTNNGIAARLEKLLNDEHLRPNLDRADPSVLDASDDMIAVANRAKALFGATTNAEINLLISRIDAAIQALRVDKSLVNFLGLYKRVQEAQGLLEDFGSAIELPISIETFLGVLQQELCIQADMETRWENLVRSMAPNCAGFNDVFNAIATVLRDAIGMVSAERCSGFTPSIPPHFETSLDSIVDDVDRNGRGRPRVLIQATPRIFGR